MADGQVTLPQTVPELTLGWEAIAWLAKYLRHPDGPRPGKPFEVTDSQALFLLNFYALTPEGRWVYDRGARRWPKGAGKSPFAAAHALVEFLGPVRLDEWDPGAPGGCTGKPVPMPLARRGQPRTSVARPTATLRSCSAEKRIALIASGLRRLP